MRTEKEGSSEREPHPLGERGSYEKIAKAACNLIEKHQSRLNPTRPAATSLLAGRKIA